MKKTILNILYPVMIFAVGYFAGKMIDNYDKSLIEKTQIKFSTELGDILFELEDEKAPISVSNFLRYVDEDMLDSASFYRTVRMDNQPNNEIKIEVIQGGLGFLHDRERLNAIPHETTEKTGILHKNGTLSMARAEPGSASSEFFICIREQTELDFGGQRNPDEQGFAAFGQVISGMDVVLKIQSLKDDGQMLINPVKILDVIRVE